MSIREAVLLTGLAVLPGLGAVAPRYSLEDLVDHSEIIVEGTVTKSWSAWDQKHQFIWTHYDIQVMDWVRGSGGGSVVVSEPGGSVDGIYQQASGFVPYTAGEHLVLFLYRTPIGYMRSTGAQQGKLKIDGSGRVKLDLAGIAVADGSGPRRTDLSTTRLSTLEGLQLAEAKSRIRVLARVRPYRE